MYHSGAVWSTSDTAPLRYTKRNFVPGCDRVVASALAKVRGCSTRTTRLQSDVPMALEARGQTREALLTGSIWPRAGDCYQIQASASAKTSFTDAGYVWKFSMITICSLGWLAVVAPSGRRERAMMEVMAGCERHADRTLPPIRPVQPVRMSFMVALTLLWIWCKVEKSIGSLRLTWFGYFGELCRWLKGKEKPQMNLTAQGPNAT